MKILLSSPCPILPIHDLADFSCGNETLDSWLKLRALHNQKANASRTYVVKAGNHVVAYYTLSAGALVCAEATGKIRRNMPDPIPMAILGRLAIDTAYQGQRLGQALFRDGALRILSAAEAIGIRGLLVHAISDEAATFYRKIGLASSPTNPRTLMTTLNELQSALGI